MKPHDELRLIERVEILAGERPKAVANAAVRIGDLAPLLQIPQMQAGAASGSTPTKAEYDALLRDTQLLHARLTEIAALLRDRLL